MPDIALAKKLIKQAAEQCVAAAQLADRHDAYEKRRDADPKAQRLLLDAEHPAVKPRVEAIDDALKAAEAAAGKNDYLAANTALDEALAAIAAAAAHKKTCEALKAELERLAPVVTGLTDVAPRANAPHIGADLALLDTLVADALAALAKSPIDAGAIAAEVKKAAAQCEVLKTRKLLKTPGGAPDIVKAQLMCLNDHPGGAKLMDDLVASLADTDDSSLVLLALEVRFKLTKGATSEGEANTAILKRTYGLMAAVPEKHVRDNPRLKQVTRKPSGGSAYGGGNMTLGDSPASVNSTRKLARAAELAAIDEDCKPAAGVPAPKFFDWNALHEIAHALDDKKNFMHSRAGDPAFGGWTAHGGDVLTVAEQVATALAKPGIDKMVIGKYLDNGTEPVPAPAGWAEAKAWADGVRHGQEPWEKGGLCAKQIGAGGFIANGRIYHEAYANDWYSYDASARSKGITGYQFRAPGEWFSELYAAFKSKVLKPAHPAQPWLTKLFS